jgi:threonylcarbamoyladenosine tRNA methylthiotransferase MtaB
MTTFHIQQFGCRATQADGAALERQLLDRGYTSIANPAQAAIVVLNTCTVTAAADAQARDAIRKLHVQNPDAKLIVTGCYAQRAPEELSTLPGVTHVVGNSHKPQIPDLLDIVGAGLAPSFPLHAVIQSTAKHDPELLSSTTAFIPTTALLPSSPAPFRTFADAPFPSHEGAQSIAPHPGKIVPSGAAPTPSQILTGDIFAHPEFLSAPIHGGESGHTRPILKIQDGCNLRCAYCIIPSVRGKSRSLTPAAVIREIHSLTSPASPYQAREIVLSGINLGSYGRDLTPRTSFLDLLCRILAETNLDRLRISSIEPQDVTQDLIDLVASTGRIAHHFHMPLQSASNQILNAMHRRYRIAHYAARLDRIHAQLPNAAIGADVIAGFPGETEQDHAATLSFIEQNPFTYLHVFSYSSRPGTKAATHPDQIHSTKIKRRARELRALSEAKSAAFRRAQIGRTLKVLTLHRDEHSLNEQTDVAYTPALSSNYVRVQVPGIFPSNKWVDVAVKSEEGNYVIGEAASAR